MAECVREPLDLGPYRERIALLSRMPGPDSFTVDREGVAAFEALKWLGRHAHQLVAEIDRRQAQLDRVEAEYLDQIDRLEAELVKARAELVGLRGEVAYLRGDTAGERQEAERDARRCRVCGRGWSEHEASCPRHEYRPGLIKWDSAEGFDPTEGCDPVAADGKGA